MKKKIALVVDDKVTNIKVLTTLLSEENFEVISMTDPQEAVDLLNSDKCPRFSVIITDDDMPNVRGVYLVKGLRSCLKYFKIPTILYTRKEHFGGMMLLKNGCRELLGGMPPEFRRVKTSENMMHKVANQAIQMYLN